MPITASTDACCAGTEASLGLPLPGIGVMVATLVIESDTATLTVRSCARNDIGAPAGFVAPVDPLRYETARGSFVPSHLRSTKGRCGGVAPSGTGVAVPP